MAMHLVPGSPVFERRLGAFPLATYEAGETVLAAGSRTGRLLILKSGKVSIVKENVEIAKVAEAGAVFGELSALLYQPHTADVRALEASQFHVAEAAALLGGDRSALLYIAAVLARRLDSANKALIELKSQVRAGPPHSEVHKTIEKIEGLLGSNGATTTPKCSRRSRYGFCFCGLLIAAASRRAAGFRDTNDTKSVMGDIVAIQRGRMVARAKTYPPSVEPCSHRLGS